MRHLQSGRKLGVDQSHRIALLRSLTLALIEQEAIKTTPARAKELRWYAERIVTLAKRGDLPSRRRIVQLLGHSETKNPGENRVRMAIERVYNDLVPRFKTRPGGCTQIIRIATRRAGDNAELCLIRYLPAPEEKGAKGKKDKKATSVKKKAEAKTEAASSEASSHDKQKAKRKPEESKVEDKKSTKAKKKDKEG